MKQLAENVHLTPAEDALEIIDQTLLPGEKKLIRLKSRDELYEAIFSLRVRGAPAIGIFAGYALYVLARSIPAPDFSHFYAALQKEAEYLEQSRPTAVNLSWALKRMLRTARLHHDEPRPQLLDALRQEAIRIQEEDIQMNLKISQNGLSLLKPGFGLLTHCNAGPLATSVHGTALGPILLGQQQGYGFHVYSDETRPLLQGARLTAYELYEAGVDDLRQHGLSGDGTGQDRRLPCGLRPDRRQRRYRQQDRHQRRCHSGPSLRHPRVCPRPLLHH